MTAASSDSHGHEWTAGAVRRRWRGCPPRFAGDAAARKLVSLTRKYIGRDILDVGAGMGGPMRLFPRAIGLDLAPRQPRTVGGDMCAMPFKSEAFDTVFSIEVLEHLPTDRLSRGLQELHRVLRKGGYAILVVPDREDLDRRGTVCPHCGARFHWLGHVQSFDRDSLAATLRSAGLDVVWDRSLPLGFVGSHPFFGHFSFVLPLVGFPLGKSLVVVARKTG
jgi:SAM-dependent methyltransferase